MTTSGAGATTMTRNRNARQITLAFARTTPLRELDFLHDDRFVTGKLGPGRPIGSARIPGFRFTIAESAAGHVFLGEPESAGALGQDAYPKRLGVFQKVEFRRALAHAIDRETIIRNVFKGQAEPILRPGVADLSLGGAERRCCVR